MRNFLLMVKVWTGTALFLVFLLVVFMPSMVGLTLTRYVLLKIRGNNRGILDCADDVLEFVDKPMVAVDASSMPQFLDGTVLLLKHQDSLVDIRAEASTGND